MFFLSAKRCTRGRGAFRVRPCVLAALAALLILALGAAGSARTALAQGLPATATDATVTLSDLNRSGDRSPALGIGYGYGGSGDYREGGGGAEAHRMLFSARWSRLSLDYTYSHYVWHDLDDIPFDTGGRAPWKDLHDLSFQARLLRGVWEDRWHYWVNAEATSSFEAAFPGAVGAGVNGELAYDFWEGWMLGVMGRLSALNALNSDLFGEAELTLALHVSPRHLRLLLRELGLEDDADKPSRVGLSVAFSASDTAYRLRPGSPLESRGFLGIRRSLVGVYLTMELEDGLSLHAGPEFAFGRSQRIYNSTGTLQGTREQGNALGGSLGLTWKF